MGWDLALPRVVPGRRDDDILSGRVTIEEAEARSPVRIGPVFDDSPFYFSIYRPWGMPPMMARALGLLLLPIAALLALFAGLGKPRGERAGPYAASIVYFASLGLGFIAVELALLQNLTLLLGHPIFTLSVLLFTLLAASGLGSYAGGRFPIRAVCLSIAALGAAYAFALPKAVPALLPLALAARIAIAAALLAPLGFLMGMPFPRGLRVAGQGPLPAPPFYWGLNGVMSVIGSVGTVVVAVTAGFRAAMVAGSACYVLAAFASAWLPPAPAVR
jgi:hypothetical protein